MNTKRIDRTAIRQAIVEEADYWDRTSTGDLMEQESEWFTFEWTPRDDRCDRCGAKMELRQIDLHLSGGRVTLRRVGWYTCPTPGCGQTRLASGMAALADQIERLVKQTLVSQTASAPQVVRESGADYTPRSSPRSKKKK